MNILAAILSALQAHFGFALQNIIVEIPAFFIQGVLTLLDDEKTILGNAVSALLADLKAGKNYEVALTDCYNVFYNGEVTEGNKIAMAFLEKLSQIVSAL